MNVPSCGACGSGEFQPVFTKAGYSFSRCRACRTVRLNPQPSPEALAGIYGSQYYSGAWGADSGRGRVLELKKSTFRKHVLPEASLKQGARVLDCGAAFGALMEVAREDGFEPYGIELAKEAAAEIGRRFSPDRIFSGPFEDAQFPGLDRGAFDAVFMCDFIEHVRDPLAVMRKTADLLAPGGQLVLTTPDGESWSCRIMGRGWPHYKVEHLFYFNPASMAALLDRAGLRLVRSSRARKVLDLEYIQRQFNAYPRFGITGAINLSCRCASRSFRHRAFSFTFGEMLIVASRK